MRPDGKIPIRECGEPLIPIPLEYFAVESPHPYQKLGAPYGDKSPHYLRRGVITALLTAQSLLREEYPNGKLKIFDAYRPIAVQQFMVDYTFNYLVKEYQLNISQITSKQRQEIWDEVYGLWAVPSQDAAMPPPHSTGGAIDLTIVDANGNDLNMGGEIDELSERSHPQYYAGDGDTEFKRYHHHRQLLNKVMSEAGFCRHPGEWWHFSLGDRMWAWLSGTTVARYGRV